MQKVILVLAAVAACSLLAVERVAADPVWAGQCGIHARQTVWAEYGWPTLLPILARPGTLLAVTQHKHSHYSADARARGAATYAFDLHFKDKVGTPSAPADPATLDAAAQQEYDLALARTDGCTTPLIVENELVGAGVPTPWKAGTAQYRANVLTFLQDLARRGAHPVLLVAKPPFAGSSDAVEWWSQVSQVADIVREVYIPATLVWQFGPIRGNRYLREHYRQAVLDFTAMGIPARRLGLMLSFLSAKGGGGRNGLQPPSSWFQVVKWDALSVKEVARELGLGSVFSWGWQEWSPAEVDPAKPKAACVWLWARERKLCNAPRMLGPHFDASLREGQILLPRGAVCTTVGLGAIGGRHVGALEALTGDRDAALSALFERLVESAYVRVPRRSVLAAEREVIHASFHGSRSAYVAALRQRRANVALARSVLADEVIQARLELRRPVVRPRERDVSQFYSAYPELLVRHVRVSPSAPWVSGGGRDGFVVSGAAPERLFSIPGGRKTRVSTLLGTYTVRPLGAPRPLGALSLAAARPVVVTALKSFERTQAFDRWTIGRQRGELGQTTCLRDRLPQPATFDLTQYLPFLRLQ